MGGCLFFLAILCFIIGVIQLFAPESPRASSIQPRSQPPMPRPSGLNLRPARIVEAAASRSAPSSDVSGGQNMRSFPQKLAWIQVGQRIYVRHPVKGELMAHVLGRTQYSELWQRARGPQNPWVPTGNLFLGFWLEGGMFLLNWQNRYYLLDESTQLSDADIQRDFAPYARRFAQSNQTTDVYFAYPPAMWHIDDIGKFSIDAVEGEGLVNRPGAIGRFIHASGDSGRALVVEDYEGGGGQDIAWNGFQITEEDIKPE
jgi:hypothetical protein